MNNVDSIWDWFLVMLYVFFLFIWILILFQVLIDLFRDHTMGGFAKVLWVIALVFVPFLAVLVYVVARGKGMAERNMARQVEAKSEMDSYIKQTAGSSSADEISKAHDLLAKGAITQAEFDSIKAKALV